MTLYAWARRRSFPDLPAPERRLFTISDDTQVAADCFFQPDRSSRPLLLALHGLESSSDAHYMRGLASQAFRRGWSAVLQTVRHYHASQGPLWAPAPMLTELAGKARAFERG